MLIFLLLVEVEGRAYSRKHALHASTKVEHRFPSQKSVIRCVWSVVLLHVTCWKTSSVETVGQFLSGPGLIVGEIAQDQAICCIL
jgi:hypothetical protein